MPRLSSWPLLIWSVGLGLTSCALALQAIVTFPVALASGTSLVIALLPPRGGVFPSHYALAGVTSSIAALLTYIWQLGWS
jgi:hypothetical protein